ncbi:MAG TPA: tail fiber protein, partial [Telluria sp.]|nr:tail fiber protein [Telluria sp.]
MSEPFIGEIKLLAFNNSDYIPRGWALCNGQLLPINQNQALFSILGTVYGGNGTTTFALPDLRGRVPVHVSNTIPLGTAQGEEKHTLTTNEMPMHTHQVSASNATASVSDIGSATWAVPASPAYNPASTLVQMNQAALAVAGESQGHPNMQPYQAVA